MDNWISVKDKLPERKDCVYDENEYVLVAGKWDFRDEYSVTICGYGFTGWDECDSFGYIDVSKIEYWQPLPTGPTIEKEADNW